MKYFLVLEEGYQLNSLNMLMNRYLIELTLQFIKYTKRFSE